MLLYSVRTGPRTASKILEAGVQITADLVWSPSAGEETGSIPNDVADARDISQADRSLLLGPSQLAWEALILCIIHPHRLEVTFSSIMD